MPGEDRARAGGNGDTGKRRIGTKGNEQSHGAPEHIAGLAGAEAVSRSQSFRGARCGRSGEELHPSGVGGPRRNLQASAVHP